MYTWTLCTAAINMLCPPRSPFWLSYGCKRIAQALCISSVLMASPCHRFPDNIWQLLWTALFCLWILEASPGSLPICLITHKFSTQLWSLDPQEVIWLWHGSHNWILGDHDHATKYEPIAWPVNHPISSWNWMLLQQPLMQECPCSFCAQWAEDNSWLPGHDKIGGHKILHWTSFFVIKYTSQYPSVHPPGPYTYFHRQFCEPWAVVCLVSAFCIVARIVWGYGVKYTGF